MSDGIYDDVIRTESSGMNGERVEMAVEIYESADCVRDHDFRTNTHQPLQQRGSDSVRNRFSRAAAVCLVLVCVLLLTAVIVLCVHIYTKSTNYTEERDQLLTNIINLIEERDQLLTNTNLTEERDQLLTNIINLIEERDQLLNKNINLKNESNELLNQINNLTKQRDQLNQETNELWKSLCEMDGWIYYKSHFYFMSSDKKNWTESRRYCTDRGADLIIINNREEQDFVQRMSAGTKVWIGLTDSDVENTWKWVDGTNITSGFWKSGVFGEPNGRTGENCALTHSSGWADYPCNNPYQWICEKTIKTSI